MHKYGIWLAINWLYICLLWVYGWVMVCRHVVGLTVLATLIKLYIWMHRLSFCYLFTAYFSSKYSGLFISHDKTTCTAILGVSTTDYTSCIIAYVMQLWILYWLHISTIATAVYGVCYSLCRDIQFHFLDLGIIFKFSLFLLYPF